MSANCKSLQTFSFWTSVIINKSWKIVFENCERCGIVYFLWVGLEGVVNSLTFNFKIIPES